MALQDQIRQTALRYGVDPALALAVAQQESGINQGARGAAGEVGVFQLMPGTASELGVNPYNETENIEGGIAYLSRLYRQFGDWTKALAAYNGGPGNMARGTTPAESWEYAEEVLSRAQVSGRRHALPIRRSANSLHHPESRRHPGLDLAGRLGSGRVGPPHAPGLTEPGNRLILSSSAGVSVFPPEGRFALYVLRIAPCVFPLDSSLIQV